MALSRSSSIYSYKDANGQEILELLDSDEETTSSAVYPTPRASRRKPSYPSTSSPRFSFSQLDNDDQTDLDLDDDALPDLDSVLSVPSSLMSARSETINLVASDTEDDFATPIQSRKRKADNPDIPEATFDSPPPAKKSRARKDPEQARLDKEAKAAAKKADTERKKQEKQMEKARRDAERAAEKADKQVDKTFNKLITDKNTTVKDLVIEIHAHLAEVGCLFRTHIPSLVSYIESKTGLSSDLKNPTRKWPYQRVAFAEYPGMNNLIRWRKTVEAEYDEENRRWKPLAQPHDRHEGYYLLYYTYGEILQQFSNGDAAQRLAVHNLKTLRQKLGRHHQLYLLVDESDGSKSRVPAPKKEAIQGWLDSLTIEFACHVIQAKNQDAVVRWLYNITADIGIKPHKLIDRSHLPFCPVTTPHHDDGESDGKRTKPQQTTYLHMLQQIMRVTPVMSKQIVQESGFRTLNDVFKTYHENDEFTERQKADRLVGAANGGKTHRKIGSIISARVHAVFTSEDSFQLIGKEPAGER